MEIEKSAKARKKKGNKILIKIQSGENNSRKDAWMKDENAKNYKVSTKDENENEY